MNFPIAKYRGGAPYSGNQQFQGTGQQRSCGKCGSFRPISTMKKLGPYGLCCTKCRGVAT